jgi:hypothetical protein
MNTNVTFGGEELAEAVGEDVNVAAEFLEFFADVWTESGWVNLEHAMNGFHQVASFNVKRDMKRLGKLINKVYGD